MFELHMGSSRYECVDLADEAKPSLSRIDIRTESFPYVTPTYGRLFFFLKMTILAFICKNLIS